MPHQYTRSKRDQRQHKMSTGSSGNGILSEENGVPIVSPSTSTAMSIKNFECSHRLDENSLQALQHDDDEDQVHRTNTASYLTKQRLKQEALKNFRPGEP